MKIKSSFQDYYDWVAEQNTHPGDVVYERTHLTSSSPSHISSCINLSSSFSTSHVRAQLYHNSKVVSDICGIVVVDKFFKCIKRTSTSKWEILEVIAAKDSILKLSRQVRQPVYEIVDCRPVPYRERGGENDYVVDINKRIPVLREFGFPAAFSAEQMYSEIDYFMRNSRHEVPDQTPVSPMSEKEKILSHGFDLTQSFRHRK